MFRVTIMLLLPKRRRRRKEKSPLRVAAPGLSGKIVVVSARFYGRCFKYNLKRRKVRTRQKSHFFGKAFLM